MKVYTYSDARQQFASVLDEAKRSGCVRIRRRDGTVFGLRPEAPNDSPPEVKGIKLGLDRTEITQLIKKGRRV